MIIMEAGCAKDKYVRHNTSNRTRLHKSSKIGVYRHCWCEFHHLEMLGIISMPKFYTFVVYTFVVDVNLDANLM